MRKTPSMGGALVMTLKAGTVLTALEPANTVREKIGQTNEWILVRESGGKRGFVAAQFVEPA